MASVPSVYPVLRNARLFAPQRIESRLGMSKLTPAAFDQLIVHSIRRLNDKTTGSFARIVGAGTKLYLASAAAPIDTGYSGNPLSMLPFRPEQSPRAWMYIADAQRMRKVLVDGTNYAVGIAPPLAPPVVSFGPPVINQVDNFVNPGTNGLSPTPNPSWVAGGTASALTAVQRFFLGTVLIFYDSIMPAGGPQTGAPGWVSLVDVGSPRSQLGGIARGATVWLFNPNTTANEFVVVERVIPQPWPNTLNVTIQSISYDNVVGPGSCSITMNIPQTAVNANAGYSTLMEESPPPGVPSRSQTTNIVGLQIDTVLQVNPSLGGEFLRVSSVSKNPDGTVSFRTSTRTIEVAGAVLRAYDTVRAYSPTELVQVPSGVASTEAFAFGLRATIASGTGTISEVTPLNLMVFQGNNLPVQEDDTIHISIQPDNAANLTEVRLIFDVDATTNDFQHTYYFKSWLPADIQQALQGNTTIQQGRSQSYSGLVVNQNIGSAGGTSGPGKKVPLVRRGPVVFLPTNDPANSLLQAGSNYPVASKAEPAGLAGWLELTCKVSDLTKVGSDGTASLANVQGIRVQITVAQQSNVAVGSLWIGGAYGPDVGTLGAPYLYRQRYRSSFTGAKSLAGPPIRNGLEPHRHSLSVLGPTSPDGQVDVIDTFRWGGSLPQWTYVGTSPNVGFTPFLDLQGDIVIANNPLLDTDKFQPFPTVDLPRSGVCSVVGTTVTQVSGSLFNKSWYPGSEIVINGIVYHLYAQPSSTTQLEIVENGGTQTNVPFQINQATILGVPLPSFWGPYSQGTGLICFACGDIFQPGVLFLTNPNDPDSASDVLQIEITTPSEPLQNGCMFNGNSYVWSNERMFSLYPSFGGGYVIESGTILPAEGTNLFVPLEVQKGKGLFGRSNLAVGSRSMFYRSREGINRTGGGASESITDAELSLLFPHGETSPGKPVNVGTFTIYPPDDTQLNAQKLSYYNSFLYFDYIDTQANRTTLVYSEVTGAWTKDDYTPTVGVHYGEEGEGISSMLLGGSDGNLYQAAGAADGNGSNFPFEARMPQMSELSGGYQQVRDTFLGLMMATAAQLVVNTDGTDNLIALPATTVYKRIYVVLPAVKARLYAFGLLGTSPFSGIFQRDSETRAKTWGDQNYSKINPFSRFNRAAEEKVS